MDHLFSIVVPGSPQDGFVDLVLQGQVQSSVPHQQGKALVGVPDGAQVQTSGPV